MDSLLLEEFWSSTRFQQWFIGKVLGDNAGLTELTFAQRSISDSTGESDLEIAFADSSGGTVRFLIENKVTARFQPEQAERYRMRCDSYVTRRDSSFCYTVIVAPSRYLGDVESMHGFDKRITYEELLDWFAGAEDLGDRRNYKLALIQSAIDKRTLGYHPVEDLPVTDFWRSYWLFALEQAPQLKMPEPSPKPAGSTFIYFRPASLPLGADICHKFTKGYVDLQIRDLGGRLDEIQLLLASHLRGDMTISKAAKSAAIRIEVPRLDPQRPFADQLEAAQAGLQAAVDLLEWFLENREFMPPIVSRRTAIGAA